MKREDILKSIMEGTAILITGSGAHVTVETPDNEQFPSGCNLSKKLYYLSGIDNPEDERDLQDASETYLEKHSEEELVNVIKSILRVGSIKEEHRKLYSFNWQRVYTTNYDDVPLIATSKNEYPLIPITINMPCKNIDFNQKMCIYINGYMGTLTPDKLTNEFKLTGRSYLSARGLEESEWGAVFNEDIETADCIIIVGLSLEYDLDIKRFIYNKNVIEKTVFITRDTISDDKERKMRRLGTVIPIGMEKFVEEISMYQSSYTVPKIDMIPYYKSFGIYAPKRTIKKATSMEVYDLFMRGQIVDPLWHRKDGKYNQIVYRKSIDDVIRDIESGVRTIYLHSNLGNGKTMFIETLKHKLQNKNYHFFTLKEVYQGGITAKEIKSMMSISGKKIVVIENYYNYLSVIKEFSLYDLECVQFIFSARSVLYDTRIMEVNEYLKIGEGESAIYDLNKLNWREISEIHTIIDSNGLWGRNSKLPDSEKRKILTNRRMGNQELQGIMLLVNSFSMKKRIEDVVANIKNMSESYYEVFIFALLIKTMSLNISANDMSKILNTKMALDARFTQNPNVQEILEFSSGAPEFKIRSAVTAKAILQLLDCNETIIQVLTKTAHYAARYVNNEKYENVLKNIISYSHVRTFLLRSDQKEIFLFNYYNELRDLEYYNNNSFYWLQYAIACINIERYDLAQTYIDNAYGLFRESESVVPFQLDTQQARLNLLMIKKHDIADVKETFLAAHKLLMKPVISKKDNPVKQIVIFWVYVDKEVQGQMIRNGYIEEYRSCCAEAYNKIQRYRKSQLVRNYDGNNLDELAKRLMKCSLMKKDKV